MWGCLREIWPQPMAKIRVDESRVCLLQFVPKIPWDHNILLMETGKEPGRRKRS